MQGCADVVIDAVKHNLGAIAGGAIVLGLFQVSITVYRGKRPWVLYHM